MRLKAFWKPNRLCPNHLGHCTNAGGTQEGRGYYPRHSRYYFVVLFDVSGDGKPISTSFSHCFSLYSFREHLLHCSKWAMTVGADRCSRASERVQDRGIWVHLSPTVGSKGNLWGTKGQIPLLHFWSLRRIGYQVIASVSRGQKNWGRNIFKFIL